MIKLYAGALFGASFILSSAAFTQSPEPATVPVITSSLAPVATPAVAPAAMIINKPDQNILRAGTTVALRTLEELTTKGKRLKVGQRFNLEVSEAVQLNGRTVIPVGSVAIGEITSVRNKGMWGKSGNIEARVLYLRTNGQQMRLSGTINDKGTTGTAGVVGAVALIPVAGFFMTGTSAVIPHASPMNAFLDEDVPVAFAENSAPAAMVVPAVATSDVAPVVATPVEAATTASSAPTMTQ